MISGTLPILSASLNALHIEFKAKPVEARTGGN